MKNSSVKYMSVAGMVAAVYTVLTLLSSLFGLSSGVIQVRLSEALCVLPFFTASAIPGLFLGCIVSNLVTGCMPLDTVFGSLATLVAAIITYYSGKVLKMTDNRLLKSLVCIPNIIANTITVPIILRLVYGLKDSILYIVITVGIGEIISSGVLGIILLFTLENKKRLFL